MEETKTAKKEEESKAKRKERKRKKKKGKKEKKKKERASNRKSDNEQRAHDKDSVEPVMHKLSICGRQHGRRREQIDEKTKVRTSGP
jgi:hypothetical protein